MKQKLEIAKKIIASENKNYYIENDCFPVHLFATENILGCHRQIPLEEKKVLTVCSSSDQLFYFLLKGARVVETYDLNLFTSYFFYLKSAAIQSLEIHEFLDFFFPKNFLYKGNVFSEKVYNKLRTNIKSKDALKFWDDLFEHYFGYQLYESDLFSEVRYSKKITKKCNSYLKNEENYYLLRKKLQDYQHTFYHINILEDEMNINQKYDYIYLSNIFDYIQEFEDKNYIQKVKEVLKKLDSLLSYDGIIGVSYLYCYLDEYWLDVKNGKLKSSLIRMKFFDEQYSCIDFDGIANFSSKRAKDKDALMLYRKK